MIDERGRQRGDDLLSALIDAEEAGDRLSHDELVAMVVQLIFAGHETTQNLLGNGLYRLLQNPDQLALLRADPGLIPAAVEEMLRYDPPILFTSRIATTDLELGGVPVAADQLVMLNLTAGNHDPARFPEPARFDVTRRRRPAPVVRPRNAFLPRRQSGSPRSRRRVQDAAGSVPPLGGDDRLRLDGLHTAARPPAARPRRRALSRLTRARAPSRHSRRRRAAPENACRPPSARCGPRCGAAACARLPCRRPRGRRRAPPGRRQGERR